MLPGVGIFGSDPIAKVLIQLLQHFGFEIHAIWTNTYDPSSSSSGHVENGFFEINKSLITTSIDNVLLNKHVDLVFVCCQPSLHSQICSKALGIGKNVICCYPTCKDSIDIEHMISSSYYYPSLLSSIYYGGLNYLTEYVQMKSSLPLVGDIKLCNITINCRNLIGIYNLLNNNNNNAADLNSAANNNLNPNTNIIEFNKNDKNKIYSQLYTNWNGDTNLGGGCLNRFGSAIVSLVLYLFDNKKINKLNGCIRTCIQNINAGLPTSTSTSGNATKIRQLTADDYCSFQLNLEPDSVLVNVTINSLVECKYNQEVVVTGTNGCLILNNTKLVYRTRADLFNKNIENKNVCFVQSPQKDAPPPLPPLPTGKKISTTQPPPIPPKPLIVLNTSIIEREIDLCLDKHEVFVNTLLKSYSSIEDNYPELPILYIRGLYYYLLNIKEKFKQYNDDNNNNTTTGMGTSGSGSGSGSVKLNLNENLNNFEHLRIVQSIVSSIYLSSSTNKWICVNY